MSRARKYLDIDVLTAAKQRVSRIFDTHDTVVVCFSGGKDSLVVLHLVKDEAERRGQLPVNVVFNDEELIPDEVIDFVNEYRQQPWLNMLWMCVPLVGTQYLLGGTKQFVIWDPTREHMRPMPPWSIKAPPGYVAKVNGSDELTLPHFRGKVAYCTGVRAAESLMRHQSCMIKLHETYIARGCVPRQSMCKPIYDWSEDDIFKFFYERNIKYTPLYDAQVWGGIGKGKLRVSTPLHAEARRSLSRLSAISPEFYNRLCSIFPETTMQVRYGDQMSDANDDVDGNVGDSFESMRKYLEAKLDAVKLAQALKHFNRIERRHIFDPDAFPLEYVFQWVRGGCTRNLLALPPKKRKTRV